MICWMLVVALFWWLSWFITMKGVELVQIYSNNWWEEVRTTDDAGISLVCNSLTEFQIIFYLTRRYSVTVWRVAVSMLVEDVGPK